MPRPAKDGLDYFPMDVNIMSDLKLMRARVKYGYLANQVYLALLCLIYREKGYYAVYNAETAYLVVMEITAGVAGGSITPDCETIQEVIAYLAACQLFDRELFAQGILTSYRIQKVYYLATMKRKYMQVIDKYWLLTTTEMRQLSKRHCLLNTEKTQEKDALSGVNDGSGTQSKEKQIEIEIEIESKTKQRETAESRRLQAAFQQRFGRPAQDGFWLRMLDSGKQEQFLEKCIERAAKYHANNPEGYIHALANGLLQDDTPQAATETAELAEWDKLWIAQVQNFTAKQKAAASADAETK